MYIFGNTQSAFTTELLDGCLWNLVGMKFSLPAHVFRLFIRSALGGQEGVKESFKDKRLYLNAAILVVVSARYSKGWIQGGAKKRLRKGFSFDEILLQTKCSQQHTDVLPTTLSTHAFIWILTEYLLLVIRWAIKGPWASSLINLNCLFEKENSTMLMTTWPLKTSVLFLFLRKKGERFIFMRNHPHGVRF